MTGSGLGNFGLASAGQQMANLFGQQPWATEARTRLFSNAYNFALTRGGTRSLSGISEDDVNFAREYASSFLPIGATFVGGSTNTFASAGSNVPSFFSGGMKYR